MRKGEYAEPVHSGEAPVVGDESFDSTELALTVWFQALYLMTQDKKGVSAMKLHPWDFTVYPAVAGIAFR